MYEKAELYENRRTEERKRERERERERERDPLPRRVEDSERVRTSSCLQKFRKSQRFEVITNQ